MDGYGPRRHAAAVGGLVLAVLIAAVLLATAHRSSGPAAAAPPSVTGAGVAIGTAAPVMHGTGLDGAAIDLGTLRGDVVVVDFFATWCIPCRDDLPVLQRTVAAKAATGLHVVAVDHTDGGDVHAFLHSLGVTLPALLDPNNVVGDAYRIASLPTAVVVDRSGRVSAVLLGDLTQARLDTALEQAGLGASSPPGIPGGPAASASLG